jgi:hypothetical protein
MDQDLLSTTRYFWRARMTQGTTNSDWSSIGKFKTLLVGYNSPGELYDPLMFGETIGERIGATTFVPGRGIRLEDQRAYVRYRLPQTLTSGEFSMEVEGLRANGPGGKPKVFQMMDSAGNPSDSPYLLNVQYRGSPGNPDNCIAFKAIWGSYSRVMEPDLALRSQSVRLLDPSRTYFWQAIWDTTSFRLVIRDGGIDGTTIYDVRMTMSGGNYAPNPHYAFLGSNFEQYVAGNGTFPGITIRNVWLSNKPRPTGLGSALRPANQG